MINILQRILAVAGLSVTELFRRRDVIVAFLLAAVILVPLAAFNLFDVKGVVRYLRELALLLVWLFSVVITITTAARQVPAEIEARTIYPLLAKPLRRGEFLVGKFLGAAAAAMASTLLFYVCYALLVGIKEGAWPNPVFLQAVVLHLAALGLLAAVVILGSVLLTPSANITVAALLTAGMLLFGQRLADVAGAGSAVLGGIVLVAHLFLPHFEFFDLRLRVVHSWPAVDTATFLAVLLYAALYTGAALALAAWRLQKRSL
jgi:ABC-type transport system involved in multi-copper enzyme maturation permease subunit